MNTNFPLPTGELHVWFVDLYSFTPLPEAAEGLLSPEERSRANRFVFPRDRRRYVGAHVALREILGAYLGKFGGDLAITCGSHGKPSFEGSSEKWLRFNLAHSHEGALIACARELEVGIDMEWIRDGVDAELIVASSFSADERSEWAAIGAAERQSAFFAGWVRKEAYVKAIGEGLSHPASAYSVRLAATGAPELLSDTLRPGAEARWFLHGVEVPAGYVAAAAAPRPLKVKMRTWGSSLFEASSIQGEMRPSAKDQAILTSETSA